LQELELVCDRVAILQKGLLRHVGPVDGLTHAASSGVTFRVVAGQSELESALTALNEAGIACRRGNGDKSETLIVDSTEQPTIDQVVDTFRRAEISIASISRERLTLEQAFLQLVDRDSDETDDVQRSRSTNDVPAESEGATEGRNS